jgi:small multidrug resistance pump
MPTWILLALAIGSEVVGTTALRESDGFTKPIPVVIMLLTYACSLYLLSVIVREFSLGLTYAIWAGSGTALIAVVGAVRFDEPLGVVTVLGIAAIIFGIVIVHAGAG